MDTMEPMDPMSEEPDEGLEERTRLEEELRAARLDAFGLSLAKTRSDAIKAKKESGIEDIWLEDDEHFEGIDDLNRGEVLTNINTKPPGQGWAKKNGATGSTVFPNITAPYVNSAAAKVSDMSMPTDNANFDLKPTPVVDAVVAQAGGQQGGLLAGPTGGPPPGAQQMGMPQPNMQQMGMPAPAAGAPPGMLPPEDQPETEQSEAELRAKKAKKRIEDWMVECQYHRHLRGVIFSAAKIGSGVIKGPIPEKRRRVAVTEEGIQIVEEIKPVSKEIDPWNLFPDGACGDSIHNGSYIWERSYLTEKQLSDYKGSPGYLDAQIDRCLKEGPQRAIAEVKKTPDSRNEQKADSKRFEAWLFYGRATKEDIEAAGCKCEDENQSIPAIVVLVNNHVIKASFNPLDTGEFPYDILTWQRVSGSPWGRGVGRLARTAQRMITAAWRRLMDNTGVAGGPMWIYKQGLVEPIDGIATIAPLKGWRVAEDADIDDVRAAFSFITMPSMQNELANIIQMAMKLAEDATGLPMLMQGQMGAAPDTVGGMQILNNNGATVLRALGRALGDQIEEPHVRRYYNWLLQYGEDDEKGDFTIDARGSMVNVERAIQNQEMIGILQASMNPAYGISPKKAMHEYLISRSFDPKAFEMDDEERQQLAAQQQGGDPRAQIEQMKIQFQDQSQQRDLQFKAQMETAKQQYEAAENDKDRQVKMVIAQISERLGDAAMSSEERRTLAEIKARLSETAVKVNLQRELSPGNQVVSPPSEPAGRAPDGMAYQR